MIAAPAFAQTAEHPASHDAPAVDPEKERAVRGALGDSAKPHEPGSEHHTGGHESGDAEHGDPSKHFNYFGITPGKLFDYRGKDVYGGPMGDGKMVDPHTGEVAHHEEPASPPFVFMLLNFAILLGLLAWKGAPIARQVAAERHDLIKNALDEAARLRQQAANKLAEYETKLKDADAQIKQLIEGMRTDAENDKKAILAKAEAQAQQMKREAEQRIAAEIEAARAQLTREVSTAAAAATEKLLRDKMTAGDQQNLVNAFITDVQGGGSSRPTGRGQVR